MPFTDNPAAADWDRYCEEREAEYQAFIEGKTCRGCWHCYIPEDEGYDNPTHLAFCLERQEFTEWDCSVAAIECSMYTE